MILLDVYGESGFSASWGWTPDWEQHVADVKKTAGFKWHKASKTWRSDGPEVLLDLARYKVPHQYTTLAFQRAKEFRCQLDKINAVKYRPLSGELYDYQLADAETLALQGSAILGNDMGLGKSKIALDAAVRLGAKMILVLAPKTLTYNWADEVEKWHPELSYAVVPDTKREAFWRDNDTNVWIANYEKVLLKDWPGEARWDVVILDEVTACKNTKAQRSKKVRQIAAKAGHVFGLSGTPLEMRPEELHGVMTVVRPSVLGDFWRFREQHLMTDTWGAVVGFRQGGAELLKERVAPWLIRRRKDEVLGLPPKLYNTRYVELSPAEATEYGKLRHQFVRWLRDNERDLNQANALTQLLRLQQYTSSPQLLKEEEGRGSKYAALEELLAEWPGKAVVFTRFAEMARRLCDWLGTDYLIAGEVRAEERVSTVRRFNDSIDARVLVSTDAGAFGLNITGADLICHHDALWNPARMWQREDRLHRIGQEKRVNVVHMVCRGTIDEGMLKVLEKRGDLFHDIIDGAEDVALKKLGVGSLRKLIEGRMSA